ncbi:MAG: GNAT family N-acetyltransferase [Clostridia bacterium]|nr:GNAT family N-acetyltransferase [Clostridia bacterium]
MDGLTLVLPSMEYKERAIDYIREFHEHDDQVHGSGSLDRYLRESSYEAWLEKIKGDLANTPSEPTYFCVRLADERIVGMVNIRPVFGEFILTEAGHVGYSVRPTERRKGYAVFMLREAVRICREAGVDGVVVSCDAGNAASAGTIMKCGGVLDAEFYSERFGEVIQRYVIHAAAPQAGL